MPLVSVAIPTYNGSAFILETLGTVFSQTFDDYEIVIVNDGSPDNTLALLEPLQKQHAGRLRVITQANSGVGAARNRALEEARGKYVALLDHDDIWMPTKLAEQVGFMERNPRCVACGVSYSLSTEPDIPHFKFSDVADDSGIVPRPFLRQLLGQEVMVTSTLMLDRERAAGIRYGTRRGAIEDVQFHVKLLTRGDFGIAGRDILATYRLHEGNESKNPTFYSEGIKLLREMLRAGEFQGLSANHDADMRAWLAQIGRVSAIRQFDLRRRRHGAELYMREFIWQARDHRWQFLLLYPLMLLTPKRLIHLAYQFKLRRPKH